MRKTVQTLLAAGLGVVLGVCGASAGNLDPAKPNVIMIYLDDLGYGDMGAYNPSETSLTPNMDTLASEGMRFTAGHSGSAVCSPSRYGILTGRYSWRSRLKSGVLNGYSRPLIENGELTIAEMFQSQGYTTAAYGKWHLGMQWYDKSGDATDGSGHGTTTNQVDLAHALTGGPTAIGFDTYYGISASLDMTPYAWIEDDRVLFDGAPATNDVGFIMDNPGGRNGITDPNFTTRGVLPGIVEKTTNFLAARAVDSEPFFIYVPFSSPHTPHHVNAQFVGYTNFNYGDFVIETDHWVGEILDALDDPDGNPGTDDSMASNTVVFLTSDNGPETGAYTQSRSNGHDANGPWRGVKRDNWEGGTRVPFVVRWPGKVTPGSATAHPCWQGDFFATMADALSYDLGEDDAPDAESFLPILLGNSMPTNGRPGFVEHSSNGQFAIVDKNGEWKLLEGTGGGGNSTSYDADDVNISSAKGTIGGTPYQLFNLLLDPGERTNVVSENAAKESELLDLLVAIRTGNTNTIGLVNHWKLDEDSGATTAVDSGPGGNDGTINGALPGQGGRLGNAYAFAVSNSVVMAGLYGITGTGSRTMSVWVKTDGFGTGSKGQGIMGWGGNASGQRWELVVNTDSSGGRVVHAARANVDGGTRTGSTVLTDEEWHMVTVSLLSDGTPNANEMKMFVDGVEETYSNTTAQSINTSTGVNPVRLGRGVEGGAELDSQGYYVGLMDDAAIWDVSLSGDEVKCLYDVGTSPALAYDASEFEELRVLDAEGTGTVVIGNITWAPATGLTANAGLTVAGVTHTLVLDSAADTGVQGEGAGRRPNIILMMADDLGWGDPSYNEGGIETPTLDTMARRGMRFNRFYSASAVCSPTRGSCLTGRNPLRLGIPNANSGRLELDETPLSEVLDSAGYTCGHFGKWHLGTLTTLRKDSNRGDVGETAIYSPPWHHQYDTCFATEAKVPTFHPMRKTSNGTPEPVDFADSNFYGTYYWAPPADPATWTNSSGEGIAVAVTNNLSGDDSAVMMDRVIPFIQQAASSNEPFFAVVWFHTPHKPLVDPQQVSSVDSVDAYTNAIQDMDMQIGRLRNELDALGVRTNTMLWFCSDNGPEDGVGQSGGLRARKRSLHEGGVRVPGLLEWPAMVTAAHTTDYPCVTSDYYPTILDALNVSVAGQKPIDGISLMPLITNPSGTHTRTNPIGFRYGDDRSWVTQQHKLISKDGGSTYELYDLLADTNETTNVIASEPEVAAQLQLELETWVDAVDNDEEYVAPATNDPPVAATPGLIKDGDLDKAITRGSDGGGNTQYYLDASNSVMRGTGIDTGRDVDSWIWTGLSKGFVYGATGGRNGSGGFVQGGDENGRPRAVFHFARDDMSARGDSDVAMDVYFEDKSGAGDLRFYIELFGWITAADGPRLTPGGPNADVTSYNSWELNSATLLLESTVYASNLTVATWSTVPLGTADLGDGYNYYAWRLGVVGARDGDSYAFDNVTAKVSTGTIFAVQ